MEHESSLNNDSPADALRDEQAELSLDCFNKIMQCASAARSHGYATPATGNIKKESEIEIEHLWRS